MSKNSLPHSGKESLPHKASPSYLLRELAFLPFETIPEGKFHRKEGNKWSLRP
jgi:hypothetical protein